MINPDPKAKAPAIEISKGWTLTDSQEQRSTKYYSTTFEMSISVEKGTRCPAYIVEDGSTDVQEQWEHLVNIVDVGADDSLLVELEHSTLSAIPYAYRRGFVARVVVQADKPSKRFWNRDGDSRLVLPDPVKVQSILQTVMAASLAEGEKLVREKERNEAADQTAREAVNLYNQICKNVMAKARKATRFTQRLAALVAEHEAEVEVILTETRNEIESDLSAYSSGEVIPESTRAAVMDALDRRDGDWSPLPRATLGLPHSEGHISRQTVLDMMDKKEQS